MQPRIVDRVVEKRNIGRREPFQDVSSAKRHPQPKSLSARTGKKVATRETFWIGRVIQVEVAYVTDVLDVIEKKRNNPPGKIQQIDPPVAYEGRQRKVPGKCFASEPADDHLFVGGGHGTPGIVAWERDPKAKKCSPGSQYANAVLHLRFVPTHQHLDKHLIRLSLHAVLGRV